jgi:hypothetical protein
MSKRSVILLMSHCHILLDPICRRNLSLLILTLAEEGCSSVQNRFSSFQITISLSVHSVHVSHNVLFFPFPSLASCNVTPVVSEILYTFLLGRSDTFIMFLGRTSQQQIYIVK